MDVVEFQVGHLDLLNKDIITQSNITVEVLREYAEHKREDVMLTFIAEDRIVCVAGIIDVWDGVGEAYNLLTKYLKPIHARQVKAEFDSRAEFYDRIQTHSKEGTFERWHELMGFHKEGLLEKYLDGENYTLWARVNGRRDTDTRSGSS